MVGYPESKLAGCYCSLIHAIFAYFDPSEQFLDVSSGTIHHKPVHPKCMKSHFHLIWFLSFYENLNNNFGYLPDH